MTRNVGLLLFLSVLLASGCATTRFTGVATPDVSVDPSGIWVSQIQGTLMLKVRQTNAPRGLSRSITAFELTVINPTDTEVEFIPKEFVLFNEYGNQFFPLNPDALLEAASATTSRSSVYLGYGVGSHSSAGYLGYRYGFGVPYYAHPRRTYQGVLAKAFPLHPVVVYPNSNLSGVLYFPVGAREFDEPRLQIVRFIQHPREDMPPPQQALYSFSFRAKSSS